MLDCLKRYGDHVLVPLRVLPNGDCEVPRVYDHLVGVLGQHAGSCFRGVWQHHYPVEHGVVGPGRRGDVVSLCPFREPLGVGNVLKVRVA